MAADGSATYAAHGERVADEPSAAPPQAADGHEPLEPAALARLLAQLVEFQTSLTYFAAAKANGIKWSLSRIVLWAVLGGVSLLVVGAVSVTATVLLVIGLVEGVGILFAHHLWLGNITVGALLVMGLSHLKRHFGSGDWLAVLLEPDIATNAYNGLRILLPERCHKRHVAHEVQIRERLQFVVREPSFGLKEPEIYRSTTQALEESQQPLFIIRSYGSNTD